ncbi:MAG: response regulator [Terrimonas sp.]|uniref:response regulator n=1 Tax=Terrimonas sp. TaxID=1914338 RepID=UPI000D50D266|nr:response regulator [Terrimonas sp.]MBN8787538.1 response regulator [Terrimonas sp.]PVD49756.1 response regulator [Terrimonas sp.]
MTNTTLTNPSILFADDDEDLLELAKLKLSKSGFRVRISHNAHNIANMISEERPDLILLDVSMQGIDGRDICQALKNHKATSDIPVIIISGNNDIKNTALMCGADDYIEKPFHTETVKQKIQSMLVQK